MKKHKKRIREPKWPVTLVDSGSPAVVRWGIATGDDFANKFNLKPTEITVRIKLIYRKGKQKIVTTHKLQGTIADIRKQLDELAKA